MQANAVSHPLDWWAVGGYALMMREMHCTKALARHAVHCQIADYFRRTEDPVWQPIGHRGFTQLRKSIMASLVLDNDLR